MMNNMPAGPHGPPGPPPYPQRRQHEYHYPHLPQQMPYSYPPPAHQYYGPPQHQYPQQWYQPHPHQYQPMLYPHRSFQPQSPLVVTSHLHAQPFVPAARHNSQPPQPSKTPSHDPATPSTGSQVIVSPSTTPPSTSAGTPTPQQQQIQAEKVSHSISSVQSQQLQPSQRPPFSPPLPWYSVPAELFPRKIPRRKRRRALGPPSEDLELPLSLSSGETIPAPDAASRNITYSASTEIPDSQEYPTSTVNGSPSEKRLAPGAAVMSNDLQNSVNQKKMGPKPAVPIIPVTPRSSTAVELPPAVSEDSSSPLEAKPTTAPAQPKSEPPKSWAELLRAKGAVTSSASDNDPPNGMIGSGISAIKAGSLASALNDYDVAREMRISFLEPRGLVNTGNMCYMNSILQILVFCKPFYEFLDQVGKRAVHSFKSDTPLIEAMIMFMREFPVIDSAASTESLRMRLKDNELEKYGEAFIPEYVYDVIKTLPRFASMRRGHQQDAEEFLGFLLEGLHDECAQVMKQTSARPVVKDEDSNQEETDGWLEVGPKQKASVTQESGSVATESPITKIFGGKLRSELRVSGLKNSVTLEPYQPLQLDIGSPETSNITQALQAITKPETIRGEFKSSRGLVNTATKQVFIETLPPVLILHLKRFQYDNAGGTQKIWKKIGYPLELEIPREVLPPSARTKLAMQPGGIPTYRLTGVVYHHGKNASGGHYTADLRRQEGHEWIRIDDTFIRRMRSEDVASEGGEEDPKILAAALENHKRNPSVNNIFQAGFEPDEDSETGDDEHGWSQVNGSSPTTNGKKWAGILSGTGTSTPVGTGKATPKDGASKFSVKDNKVAYILFYERIR